VWVCVDGKHLIIVYILLVFTIILFYDSIKINVEMVSLFY